MSFGPHAGLRAKYRPKEANVPQTASRSIEVGLVRIPSTDQDRSVAFYESLGFEKRTDIPFGDNYRWVEIYPPNGTAGIGLAPPRDGDPVGVQTGITLVTQDIDATHADMLEAGADVDEEVLRMGSSVPAGFSFRDPDGNTLLIVEAH
jgi:predicted enzyme related to lactoylglutathione lyase